VTAAESGLQTTSFRIGQISGAGASGAWATTDWVPILVKSSVALGCLPDAAGVASWLPFDAVCQAIIDVAFAEATPDRALNLVHPRPVPWQKLMGHVADALGAEGVCAQRLPLVPMGEWRAKLADASASAGDAELQRIVRRIFSVSAPSTHRRCLQPAIKLLDFFSAQAAADAAVRAAGDSAAEAGGLTALATEKAQAASDALRTLQPLGAEDVGRWVGYWKRKGHFA
jgi:thioester reductase-like protein